MSGRSRFEGDRDWDVQREFSGHDTYNDRSNREDERPRDKWDERYTEKRSSYRDRVDPRDYQDELRQREDDYRDDRRDDSRRRHDDVRDYRDEPRDRRDESRDFRNDLRDRKGDLRSRDTFEYGHKERRRSRSRSPLDDRYNERSRRSRSPNRSEVDVESTVWAAGASCVVVLRRIPDKITETEIRLELSKFGAPIKNLKMITPGGAFDSSEQVCYIEFTTVSDSSRWMHHHQGCLQIKGEFISMSYTDEGVPSSADRDYDKGRGQYDSRYSGNSNRKRASEPTETMIVKGIHHSTTVESVRRAFEYISHFKIIDVRMVRDKFGTSRGFCFVEWQSKEECKQVLEYLQTATPRFHIDGCQVILDYSKPRYPATNTVTPTQAAQWSRSKAAIEAAAATAVYGNSDNFSNQPQNTQPIAPKPMVPEPVNNNNQRTRYPSPDTSKYKYDKATGYYYDPTTQLYYDANSRYYYNGITRQYMYWDQASHTYIPFNNTKKNDDKKETPANANGAGEKSTKNKSAKEIAKDMERWAKSQNKKVEKETNKRMVEEQQEKTKRASATADAVYSLLEEKTSEHDRQRAVEQAYSMNNFKKPLDPVKPLKAKKATQQSEPNQSGLVSYQQGSDSEEEYEEEEKLLDWDKLTCLLCRRKFSNKDQLSKHEKVSELHKTNLEARNAKRQPSQKPTDEPISLKYRDRAAERRNKYGVTDPPPQLKKFKFNQAPTPYEQPTVDGIGESNIGNKMLQKMGWNKGKGLGKTQSGITAPIMAEQRALGAGLGSRGSNLTGSSGGSYRENLKKLTQLRYQNQL